MSTVIVRTIDNIMTKEGRRTSHESPDRPVMDYCPREFSEHAYLGIIHSRLGAIDKDRARRATMFPGDEVIFYRKPGIEIGLGTAILASLIIAAISVGVQYGISALTAPSKRGTKKDLEDSETFGFDGIVNTVSPGTRIPLIYGLHRVGGQIIQQYLREAPGTVSGNTVTPQGAGIYSLIGVCSGEVDSISDLRIDKNRLSPQPQFITRLGTNHQAVIQGFTDVRTQITKDIELTGVGGSFNTTTQSEVDFFEVLFRFPGGLFRTSDRGQFLRKDIAIRIEYKEIGTPNYTLSLLPVSGSTRKKFDISWRSPLLPRANYDIRVTRLTEDDTTATGFSDVTVFAIIEILDDTQTYPGLALYSVEQFPTAQFSGSTPVYDVLVKGKLVTIYTDPNTSIGQWSDNPAWCLLDFLTDKKYGLGAFIDESRVDIQSFIDSAAFCASENLTLNIVLDGSLNAFDTIRQFCTAGRLFFLLRGDKWTVRPDKPEEPVQFFTMGRIIKDSFTATKSSRGDKANFLIGEFWNKDLDYEKDTIPKEDQTLSPGVELVESTVNLLGVTNAEQANKILNNLLLANRLQLRSVEFQSGVEALAMEAGDVFAISHDVPAWGLSGKLREVDETGTSIWLDRTVTLEVGKEYELTVFHDKHEGDPTTRGFDVVRVTNNPEVTDRLSTSGDWTDIPTKGFDYSFGELTKSYVKYRCTSITRGRVAGRRTIRAVEYNEDVYGTDLSVLPAPSVSALPDPRRIPPDVTDLRLAERIVFAEDGTLSTALDVFFTLPVVAGVMAEVFIRENGFRTWDSVGKFSTGYATITQNIRSPNGAYEVAVASISQFGVRKAPEDSPWAGIVTVGVTRQPDNVVDFRVDRTMEGLVFTWTAIDPARNFDLANYEIRTGVAWETAITIGEPKETRFTTMAFVKGENTYFIKAKNTAGKFSAVARSVIIEVDPRINENVVFTRTENPTFPGTKEGFTVVDNKLRLDTTDEVVAWRNNQNVTALGGTKYIPGGRLTGFRVAGTYTTAAFQITAGNAESALVSYELDQAQVDASVFWSASDVSVQSWNSEFARTRAWSVAPDGKVIVKVEMRFSTATSAEADFDPWKERVQNFRVDVKWAQARVHVEILDPAFTVDISTFIIYFDVPDRRDAGSASTSAVGDVTVNFNKPFQNAPKVACTIQTAAAGDDLVRGAPTTTGFSLSVFNAGSRVVRTVEYLAIGF